MKKTIHWLKIALLIQLVLAAVYFFYHRSQVTKVDSSPLLTFDQQAITQLKVESPTESIQLTKIDDQWRLPDYHNLAANQTKVESLLTRLHQFKKGWPVATSASAHERFELTDKRFKRKLQLFNGEEKVGEVMIGSSPGFKQSHVRLNNDDRVYALNLNAYELPTTQSQWLKKDLLTVDNIKRIVGKDYAVKKVGNDWLFDDDQADQANKVLINTFINNISHFNVIDAMDNPPSMTGEGVVSFIVDSDQTYNFNLLNQADKYFVKRADIEQVFVISQAVYESLVKLNKAELIVKDKAE